MQWPKKRAAAFRPLYTILVAFFPLLKLTFLKYLIFTSRTEQKYANLCSNEFQFKMHRYYYLSTYYYLLCKIALLDSKKRGNKVVPTAAAAAA